MLESLKNFLYSILETIAPKRVNFAIVQKLDESEFTKIGEAPKVLGQDWIHPLFPYKDSRVRAIIWELKYRENTLPLEHIGKIMYDEILSLLSDIILFNADAEFLLIPIPISNERRVERGYNQSELIAKSILENDAERLLLYAPQWFQKIKETPSQSHSQSKQERVQNLAGCFSADPRVQSKYIILIDDVVTTGSTLSEARSTLLETGVREVFAFTIAH